MNDLKSFDDVIDNYDVVVAAAIRARELNDWRRKREALMLDEPDEVLPKVTMQALEDIADGVVTVVRKSSDSD